MIRNGPLVLAALLSLSAAAVSAGPVKSGPAFPLSSCSTCTQEAPAVAGNPAGGLFAVWEGLAPAASRGVPARFFRPLGTARGGDYLARAAAARSTTLDPRLAGDARSFVAVWAEEAGGNTDVYARRFTPRGVASGAPIAVNLDDPAAPRAAEDFAPAVAMAPDGGFVVAWVRFEPFVDALRPGTQPEIYVRRFAADGSARSAPQRLSTGLTAAQRPGLCVTTGGAAVVAWSSVDAFRPFEASRIGVSVRRLQPSGIPQPRTLVLSAPLSSRSQTAVSCGGDGGYVVAWSDEQAPAADESDVLAQRFGRDGKKVGAAFVVNGRTGGEQTHPAVSRDPTGAIVVAWRSRENLDDEIRVRRFSAAGAALGDDVVVTSGEGRRGPPDLAPTGVKGNFVVAWQDPARRVLGQRFTP